MERLSRGQLAGAWFAAAVPSIVWSAGLWLSRVRPPGSDGTWPSHVGGGFDGAPLAALISVCTALLLALIAFSAASDRGRALPVACAATLPVAAAGVVA